MTARRSGDEITAFLAAEKNQNILVAGINQQIEDKTKARNFLIFVATFMDKSLGTPAFLRLFPSKLLTRAVRCFPRLTFVKGEEAGGMIENAREFRKRMHFFMRERPER